MIASRGGRPQPNGGLGSDGDGDTRVVFAESGGVRWGGPVLLAIIGEFP
jgi:hypothetical protein